MTLRIEGQAEMVKCPTCGGRGSVASALLGMPWAPVIDAALVIVFAALGRASHAEQNPVVGALATAWPFLVGLGRIDLGLIIFSDPVHQS